jgi:hypothetical protein
MDINIAELLMFERLRKSAGDREAQLLHNEMAPVFALTTKLNCMAT